MATIDRTNGNDRIDAIYARQSFDKKDSISIESQIEFCRHELRGGSAKEYQDKGFSGKNTDRPQFQQLVRDIEAGLISQVVVYKLDRISRSILDFANMMALFQKYNVEFVSSTERFDTSTPMGRAMLNICIVFAQLERETIQKRVADAYYSNSMFDLAFFKPKRRGFRHVSVKKNAYVKRNCDIPALARGFACVRHRMVIRLNRL